MKHPLQALYANETEAHYQGRIVHAAKLLGYRAYHTYDSYRSAPGFPDLVLAKPGRLIFVEVKTESGVVEPDQHWWINVLRSSGQEVYVWKPSDWPRVFRVLQT